MLKRTIQKLNEEMAQFLGTKRFSVDQLIQYYGEIMTISFNEIFEFEVGDIIYECSSGANVEVRIETKPVEVVVHKTRRALKWTATNTETGALIEYLITEGLEFYGPRLYRRPMYISKSVLNYKKELK